jgi:hypothetical protein
VPATLPRSAIKHAYNDFRNFIARFMILPALSALILIFLSFEFVLLPGQCLPIFIFAISALIL